MDDDWGGYKTQFSNIRNREDCIKLACLGSIEVITVASGESLFLRKLVLGFPALDRVFQTRSISHIPVVEASGRNLRDR